MARFDTIIRNGRIVDGTGAASYWADVGIVDGRIAAIGALKDEKGDEEIDAAGKIVAPGHVTQHAHYDAAIFWDPYISNSGENGVTTVVNSNCGFGFAPLREQDRERTMAMMETTEQIPVRHQRAALTWDWETFPEYMDVIERLPKGVNVLTYLPVNPLLVYVMGVDAAKTRAPDDAELAEMHRLIHQGMDAGAIGVSMSVMGAEGNSHVDFDGSPMPTDLMSHDTAVKIGQAVVDRGEGVIQMLSQIAAWGEPEVTVKMAEAAKGSGARVFHNIFLTSDQVTDMPGKDIAWLDGMRDRGLDVTAGTIIYRGWVEVGIRDLDTAAGQLNGVRQIIAAHDDDAIMALISDEHYVADFVREYSEMGPSNGAAGLDPYQVIDIGDDPELQHYVGRKLGEIANEEGRHVVQVLLDLGHRSKLALQMKSGQISSNDPAQAAQLLAHPAIACGVSDGGAHTKAFAHGYYATDLLVWLVRETGTLSLENMHFQLSWKPAQSMQIRDRGAIMPGFWADLLIYDLDALYVDTSRFEIKDDMPDGDWRRSARAGGYHRVIVNGVTTHVDGESQGVHPGRLIRDVPQRRGLRLAA